MKPPPVRTPSDAAAARAFALRVREVTRDLSVPLGAILKICIQSESENMRLKAAALLLAYGIGLPIARAEVDATVGPVVAAPVSLEQLRHLTQEERDGLRVTMLRAQGRQRGEAAATPKDDGTKDGG